MVRYGRKSLRLEVSGSRRAGEDAIGTGLVARAFAFQVRDGGRARSALNRWTGPGPANTLVDPSMTTSPRPDDRDPADHPGSEVAKPRFWGPASFWRLGLVALLVLIVVLLVAGT